MISLIWEFPSQLHRFSFMKVMCALFMIFMYALKAGLIKSDILQEKTEGEEDHLGDPAESAQVFLRELEVYTI